MTEFVNLTPHALRLRTDAGNMAAEPAEADIVLQPRTNSEGPSPARVATIPGGLIGSADGIALYGATAFGEVEGLPDPEEDTIYVVSALVGGRVSGRDDVFCPGTGPKDGTIRTPDGMIFAVTRLVMAG